MGCIAHADSFGFGVFHKRKILIGLGSVRFPTPLLWHMSVVVILMDCLRGPTGINRGNTELFAGPIEEPAIPHGSPHGKRRQFFNNTIVRKDEIVKSIHSIRGSALLDHLTELFLPVRIVEIPGSSNIHIPPLTHHQIAGKGDSVDCLGKITEKDYVRVHIT